jgi:hypothetical protein
MTSPFRYYLLAHILEFLYSVCRGRLRVGSYCHIKIHSRVGKEDFALDTKLGTSFASSVTMTFLTFLPFFAF